MKSTRKQRTSRRKTYRQKGGKRKCPTDTNEGQDIVNEWQTVRRILREEYDSSYNAEYHILQSLGTCNLWVWKRCETEDNASDNHLDVFWRNRNKLELGIKATRNGKNAGQKTFNLSYTRNYSQENFCQEIAEKIDTTYDSMLKCAMYDLPWAVTGIQLGYIDGRYAYNYDCNRMTYSNSSVNNYYVVVRWINFSDDLLGFTYYSGNRQIGNDSEYIDSHDFCANSFFQRMAYLLDRKYKEYMP